MSQELIAALQNPALYDHPVTAFKVIETHISWVILTGSFAYKIKKPVDFGFLNFTDLSARKHFCEKELQLNQRSAPDLYLDVLPIFGSAESPSFQGDGEVIEYALKMREFPQSQLLDEVQNRGELSDALIDQLAEQVAQLHTSTPSIDPKHPLNSVDAIAAPMIQNFEQIRPLLSDKADIAQLDVLEEWTNSTLQRLHRTLQARCDQGAIRECHGDLHLGNATLLNGDVVLFDCIEFNEPFRIIDIAYDAAFITMDLEDRGLKSQARRFMNTWLEQTGDYQSLSLINLYKATRALVRAKVNLFRLGQEEDAVQRSVILRQYRRYAQLAENYSALPNRFLVITHGLSGVGKSLASLRLVESLGAVRIRSDKERKRLFPDADSATLYSAEASKATYARLNELAIEALQAGFPVILDATFLKHEDRQEAAEVAHQQGVPFLIINCQAPVPVIRQWLAERSAQGNDISDATLEVMEQQRAVIQDLTEQEVATSQLVETHNPQSLDALLERFRLRFPSL